MFGILMELIWAVRIIKTRIQLSFAVAYKGIRDALFVIVRLDDGE